MDVCKTLSARRLRKPKDKVRAEDLASLFEIHRAHFYRLANGERIASLPLALHMAEILNTKVERLFVTKAGS